MTTDEIQKVHGKLAVLQRCRAALSVGCPLTAEYYKGMIDAYTEMLQEFGGVKIG